jgi:hypothetical protein
MDQSLDASMTPAVQGLASCRIELLCCECVVDIRQRSVEICIEAHVDGFAVGRQSIHGEAGHGFVSRVIQVVRARARTAQEKFVIGGPGRRCPRECCARSGKRAAGPRRRQ